MIQANILIDTQEGQEYRLFYFDVNRADGAYIIDSENMAVVINGADFILKFDNKVFEEVINSIKLRQILLN